MVIGITMVKTRPESEKTVYHAIKEIDGVKEVYHLFGEFDLFVLLELESKAMLNHLLGTIRDLGDVVETWPLLVSRDERLSEVEMVFPQVKEMAVS